jgi:predicted Zn-dependent peptidase
MPFATPSVSLGWRLPPTLHPDFPALQVLSVILGGPFSSRMWIEMREERGLAYSCGASLLQGVQAGGIMAYAATDKKQLQAAREIILSQVADLQDNACSKEELEIAQRYIIGTHELAHQGPSAWVEFLGASEVSGLGWEYDFEYPELIERVTPEDIQRVAATYLPIDRPVVLTVRPMGFIGLLWMALKRKILGR